MISCVPRDIQGTEGLAGSGWIRGEGDRFGPVRSRGIRRKGYDSLDRVS